MTATENYAMALHAMTGTAAPAAASSRTRFGYDAVEDRGKRKSAHPLTRSEDRELFQNQRRQLISGTRDLNRNFSIAAWAIRKHLDYVSTFTFKAKTGDPATDDKLEELMTWWAKPTNCDVASRHSLPRLTRLLELSRTIDGDVFANLLSDGRIQAIEGDRVRNPLGGLPDGVDSSKLVHGVLADDFGKAIAYAVCRRPRNTNDLVFEKLLSARYTRQLAYYTRIDQLRGISPLTSAINSFRDCYEGINYALAKAKVSQLYAMAFTRDAADQLSTITEQPGEEDGDEPRYSIDLNGGPLQIDLDPGDKAEILESATPSTEFQAFTQETIGMALKALDIPVCFYDEGRANFSSGRQGWILYNQSAASKRADLREFLDYATAWRVRMFIVDGDLKLPAGMKPDKLKWDWVHAGIPWMDPLKESAANAMEINSGLTSRQRVCKERGEDFFEIVDELAEEKTYLESKGIELTETPLSIVVDNTDPTAGKDKGNGASK